jgi:site-specific recombinase
MRRRLDAEGISVNIVYGLDVIGRSLTPDGADGRDHGGPAGPEASAAIQALVARLAGMHLSDRSVSSLAAANLQLLARKIVDRSGKTGEHYIARNLREYRHILLAAAGGGLLTVLTAAVRCASWARACPRFPEGFLAGINYAVSFLLMQAFGFVLATKQPAMTAATLATILREKRGSHRLDEIVDYTAAIVSSQIAAAISNVTFVAFGCVVFDRLWRLATGRTFLDHHDAQHVFETLSPLDSLTVLYAAETGVLLWLGSVAGGWFENWALYRKLPKIVAEHPIGTRVGRERLRRFAESLARNASGWGTNVALGFLLGMTPAFGRFFGLPLDVRHVTLSTGTLALAAADLQTDRLVSGVVIRAASGIAVMFVLNLSVSFLLSLASAARAYGLPRRELVALLGRLARRFVTRPGQFLLPAARRRGEGRKGGACVGRAGLAPGARSFSPSAPTRRSPAASPSRSSPCRRSLLPRPRTSRPRTRTGARLRAAVSSGSSAPPSMATSRRRPLTCRSLRRSRARARRSPASSRSSSTAAS